jgi:predicted small secreted protein
MQKLMYYTAGLVALYLVVANATGFGNDLKAAGSAYSGAVKTLQGR